MSPAENSEEITQRTQREEEGAEDSVMGLNAAGQDGDDTDDADEGSAAPTELTAPFPWFGGKRSVAPLVWSAFGRVDNYVEPFAGSIATLLANPDPPRQETVNDLDGFVANFWRAVQQDPEAVARWADYPVSEIDLYARHGWLVNRRDRLAWSMEDPEFYDPKIAGWWVWGACAWIGSGWCSGRGPWRSDGAHIVKGVDGQGINRQMPHLGDAGRGAFIRQWFEGLAARLRDVRITCGDWSRVLGPSPTTRLGMTAVFLAPPYGSDRDDELYAHDSMDVAAQVGEWARAHGEDANLRIALCGYEGEFELPGWSCVPWKARGGYGSQGAGRGRENATKERIWFSPGCIADTRPVQIGLEL